MRIRLSLVALLLASAAHPRKPITLEDVAATRAGSGPSYIWAPDSKSFVWRQGTKLIHYDIAARSRKDLLDLKPLENQSATAPEPEAFAWVNRGVREQPIQWSADSARLLLLLKGDLFLFDIASAKTDQLTRTTETEHDPKLSPDARRISFRRTHDLFVLEIASKKVTRLTNDGSAIRWNAELDWVYPEELALSTAHWWSPDSRRIAYLQFDISPILIYPHGDLLKVRPVYEPERYPQAGTPNANVRLGVIPAAGGKTKWIELPGHHQGNDRLKARVTWLPDSSALAVHSYTRVQDKMSLLLVGNDKPRSILEESDPAWLNLRDDFAFLKNSRRLVWGAERPNFRHLYLYSLDGGTPKPITSGDFEVADLACVDEPDERLFYAATDPSPVERHLYSISFDGSGKRRLTFTSGTHSISMSPDCGHYVDSHSSLREPTQRTLHSSDGAQIAVLAPRNEKILADFDVLPAEILTFTGSGGTLFYARLLRPRNFDASKKYPAIVMVYGGPHAQSVRDSWRGLDWDQALAHQGFVIWQMDNRGSAGRGHLFESPLHRRFGKQELADQLEGVRHLVSMGFVDPERIGVYGWSYGGYMTLYSLFNAPDTFKAGIAGAPVTDWRNYDTIYTERYLGLPQRNEEGYKEGSPVHQAGRLKSALMLAHNFEDDNVLFQHTLRMMDALQKANKPFDLLLYPQKTHSVTGPVRRHMLEAMTAFFRRHLN